MDCTFDHFDITQVTITPAMARELLQHNTRNRRLRDPKVKTYLAAYLRGEHVLTHQGIAFDKEGILLDGQHRLEAMALMPDGWEFPMLVTRGLDRSKVFGAIDEGLSRTLSDRMELPRVHGEVTNFLAKLFIGRGTGISADYAAPFHRRIAPLLDDLLAFCGSTTKTWSSAPVRAAAVVCMMAGEDADYVKLVYHAMVKADFAAMPKVAQALFAAHLRGSVRAGGGNDMFVRCLKIYDRKNADLKKVQIINQAAALDSVRALLSAEVMGKTNSAPQRGFEGL